MRLFSFMRFLFFIFLFIFKVVWTTNLQSFSVNNSFLSNTALPSHLLDNEQGFDTAFKHWCFLPLEKKSFFCDFFGMLLDMCQRHHINLLTKRAQGSRILLSYISLLRRLFTPLFFSKCQVITFDVDDITMFESEYPGSHHLVSKTYALAFVSSNNLTVPQIEERIFSDAIEDKHTYFYLPDDGLVVYHRGLEVIFGIDSGFKENQIIALLGPSQAFRLNTPEFIYDKLYKSTSNLFYSSNHFLLKSFENIYLIRKEMSSNLEETDTTNESKKLEKISILAQHVEKKFIIHKDLLRAGLIRLFLLMNTQVLREKGTLSSLPSFVGKCLKDLEPYIRFKDHFHVLKVNGGQGKEVDEIVGCLRVLQYELNEISAPIAVFCQKPSNESMPSLDWNWEIAHLQALQSPNAKFLWRTRGIPSYYFVIWIESNMNVAHVINQAPKEQNFYLAMYLTIEPDQNGSFAYINDLIKKIDNKIKSLVNK